MTQTALSLGATPSPQALSFGAPSLSGGISFAGMGASIARTAEDLARAADDITRKIENIAIGLRRVEDLARKQNGSGDLSAVNENVEVVAKDLNGPVNGIIEELHARVNRLAGDLLKQRLTSLLRNPDELPHIVMLGKPAAGKGTLSKMLSEKFGYVHVSIGDIHRGANEAGTPIGLRIRACIERRDFFGNEMVQITRELLDRKFEEICSKGQRFILDNFPTATSYLPYMQEVIDKHHLSGRVILIVPEISDVDTVSRLLSRVVCSNKDCGKIFNLDKKEFRPLKEGICDGCNSPIVKRIDEREDDIPGKIKSYKGKIDVYEKFIKPVISALIKSNKMESFVLDNDELRLLFQKV